jgi:dual-specificity kinase
VNGTSRLSNTQYSAYSNASTSTNSDSKRASGPVTPSTRASVQLPPPTPSSQQMTHDEMSQSARRRQPDWSEFYKNGVPKEIIVIDDDTPEPQGSRKNDASYERPADKKRKTGASYDPIYNPQPSYSTTQTPGAYYENSSANHTASTDRTAPAYKATGSSSIGPSITNGLQTPLDDPAVGQKRKRAVRAADDKAVKRREVEQRHQQAPHFDAYIPPPHPPKKARDVHVPVVRDVS